MGVLVDASGEARDDAVERAATALRNGGLVVLPTDTVYGLAADAFNPRGTGAIFAAKDRERRLPLPVLLRSQKQLTGLTPVVPEAAELLMAAFWPGPLTLVLPAEPNLQWDLGRTDGTVAVRMPLDDLALDVIRAVGPLAVTSANRSGQAPATTAADALEQLGDAVALYLDDGPRANRAPSTVVDLTRREPHVLREGELPADHVLAVATGQVDPLEAAMTADLGGPVAGPPPDDRAGEPAPLPPSGTGPAPRPRREQPPAGPPLDEEPVLGTTDDEPDEDR